jgi:predicted RNA-binding Zn-ribbon protein involved in translation (DUF1610 family)
MGLKRKDYTCRKCGYTHEKVWILVKRRGHLYCPKCMENPKIARTQARM